MKKLQKNCVGYLYIVPRGRGQRGDLTWLTRQKLRMIAATPGQLFF